MNQLAERLYAADQVCTRAYPFFEQAAAIRQEAEEDMAKAMKKKKRYKICAVIGILFLLELVASPLALLLGKASFLVLPVMIGGGVLLYKLIAVPAIEKMGHFQKEKYARSMDQARQVAAEGAKIFEDNSAVVAIVPEEYRYPLATNYLYKAIQTGRAGDLGQALTLFDEQLHRWNIEEANAQIVAQQQAQTQALKGIRKSSAINATANVVSAVSNVARWF